MRKILCALVLLCLMVSGAFASVSIDSVNFPDDVFRAYVSENFDTDSDDVLSDSEISAAETIRLNYYDHGYTASLKGIEHLTALKHLICSGIDKLTELDLSQNTALMQLSLSHMELTELDLSHNTALTNLTLWDIGITELDLSNNTALTDLTLSSCMNITALDLSNNTALTELSLDGLELTAIDLSKLTALTNLSLENIGITTLDVSNNTALTELTLLDTRITGLDISHNTALTYLWLNNDSITKVDLSHNTALEMLGLTLDALTELDLSNNTALTDLTLNLYGLTELDLSNNTALTYLSLNYMKISELDLSHNTALTYLSLWDIGITELDLSRNTALTYLSLWDIGITELDLSHNNMLTGIDCCNNRNLETLNLSGCSNLDTLECAMNKLKALDVSECPLLTYIRCEYNNISTFVAPPSLEALYCQNNLITSLDLSASEHLYELHCDYNLLTKIELNLAEDVVCSISCSNNRITEFDGSAYFFTVVDEGDPDDPDDDTSETYPTVRFTNIDDDELIDESGDIIPIEQSVPRLDVSRITGGVEYLYQLDMNSYVSSSGLSGIIASSVKGFDENNSPVDTDYSNGIARFATEPSKVVYQYDTGVPYNAENPDEKHFIFEVTIGGQISDALTVDGHVYRIINTPMTWQAAKDYCEVLGGHLATITSPDEHSILKQLLKKASTTGTYDYQAYWLGADRDADSEDVYDYDYDYEEDVILHDDITKWHWITGEDFTLAVLSNFDQYGFHDDNVSIIYYEESELDIVDIYDTGKYGLQVSFSGEFRGINRNVARGFICEWEPVTGNFAGYSDEYKQYIANPDEYESMGAEPEPFDFSYLQDNPPEDSGAPQDLPLQYDPRGSRALPVVKNQYIARPNYQTCWAFASISALEASYLAQGFSSSAPDLSELHMAWFVYKDPRASYRYLMKYNGEAVLNQRGNYDKSINFLSRIGATTESEMPYNTMSQTIESNPPAKYAYPEDYPHPVRLKEAYQLGPVTAANRDIVKGLIYGKGGAVAITYQHSRSGENDTKTAYYYDTEAGYGHAVIIVGWNDDYPHTNFKNDPGKNGAWLAMNSEGSSYGENGFFWISYEQNIGASAVFIAADSRIVKPYGHNSAGVITPSEYKWTASVFQTDAAETMNEVAFHTLDNNVEYEVYVNKHGTEAPLKPEVPDREPDASGTMSYMGYHSISLNNPVALDNGEYFSVIVRLKSKNYPYAVPAEDKSTFRSAGVTTAGKSYFAATENVPALKDWIDGESITVNGVTSPREACIKIFTVASGSSPSNTNTNTGGNTNSNTGGNSNSNTGGNSNNSNTGGNSNNSNTGGNSNNNTGGNSNNNTDENTTSGSSGGGGCSTGAFALSVILAGFAFTRKR